MPISYPELVKISNIPKTSAMRQRLCYSSAMGEKFVPYSVSSTIWQYGVTGLAGIVVTGVCHCVSFVNSATRIKCVGSSVAPDAKCALLSRRKQTHSIRDALRHHIWRQTRRETCEFGLRRKKIIVSVSVLHPRWVTVFCMGYIWSAVSWSVTSSHFNRLIAILKASVDIQGHACINITFCRSGEQLNSVSCVPIFLWVFMCKCT